MKERERGVLTVETSIVLTLCIFFILFLFSFARIYSAQSLMSHAVLQTSDAIALESYLRETALTGSEEDVVKLANRLTGVTTLSADSFTSLRSADISKIAKEKFTYAVANSEANANKKLKKLGVKDGIAGVDFSASRIDLGNDDVIIYANYTLEMQFPIFGFKEISVSKAAKAKTFGDILFEIQTIPQKPHMGSAAGGGNYKHGTQIQISATPNYGYKFVKWEDGSTENPRTVTVNGAKTYVAVFTEDQFGINVAVKPSDGGSVSGAGVYNYLTTQTVKATAKPGYSFLKWTIHKHKDDTKTEVKGTASQTITVDQSYTCTAHFSLNSYKITTRCEGGPSNSYAKVDVGAGAKQSATAKYKSSFKITASSVPNYKFVGWKIQGKSNYFSTATSVNLTVPPNDIVYVACYRSTIKTVRFYNYDGSIHATRTVAEGNSLGGNMPSNPFYDNYVFNGWSNFGSGTKVYNDVNVYGSWSRCRSHDYGHCGVVHPLDSPRTWAITSAHRNESHKVTWASCTRCIFCKKLGTYRVLCGTHWEKWGAGGWKGFPYVGANACGGYNLP